MDTYGIVDGSANSYFCSECTATYSPSDNGSDGNFYCINGGNVIGSFGSCTCISCNTGVGGPNCAICTAGYSGTGCAADDCQATSTSKDAGSDGNFYCINGGDIGGTTGSCTCSSCNTGFYGISCQLQAHNVVDMNHLFNTVSNADSESTSNTGNSIMENGDTAILAVRLYKCSEGTCASIYSMLYTDDLNGEVKCVEDNASCVLDGENERRGMFVSGTRSGTLILQAISFKEGKGDKGGGAWIGYGAIVEIHLCVFTNCRATDSAYGGGAIYATSTSTVNIYGTSFNGNTSPGFGEDIYSNKEGIIDPNVIIHDTCPSPYSFNTPIQGKTNKERMAEAASTNLTSTTPTQLFTTQEKHPLVLTMLSVAKSFHFPAVLTTPVMQVFRTQRVGSLFQIVQLARLERLATVEQRLV